MGAVHFFAPRREMVEYKEKRAGESESMKAKKNTGSEVSRYHPSNESYKDGSFRPKNPVIKRYKSLENALVSNTSFEILNGPGRRAR